MVTLPIFHGFFFHHTVFMRINKSSLHSITFFSGNIIFTTVTVLTPQRNGPTTSWNRDIIKL